LTEDWDGALKLTAESVIEGEGNEPLVHICSSPSSNKNKRYHRVRFHETTKTNVRQFSPISGYQPAVPRIAPRVENTFALDRLPHRHRHPSYTAVYVHGI
jgi:hypothetical protein